MIMNALATETMVEERTKQDFLTCVSGLRLLAKFTSFTISLPFKSAANSPEWHLSQIQLRGRVSIINRVTEKLQNGMFFNEKNYYYFFFFLEANKKMLLRSFVNEFVIFRRLFLRWICNLVLWML